MKKLASHIIGSPCQMSISWSKIRSGWRIWWMDDELRCRNSTICHFLNSAARWRAPTTSSTNAGELKPKHTTFKKSNWIQVKLHTSRKDSFNHSLVNISNNVLLLKYPIKTLILWWLHSQRASCISKRHLYLYTVDGALTAPMWGAFLKHEMSYHLVSLPFVLYEWSLFWILRPPGNINGCTL